MPRVEVVFVDPTTGDKSRVWCLFDTGATYTVLHYALADFIGVANWKSGQKVPIGVVGHSGKKNATKNDRVFGYLHKGRIEVFGKAIDDCPILLTELEASSYYKGLLGRFGVFRYFGFGFWESARELYVTLTP